MKKRHVLILSALLLLLALTACGDNGASRPAPNLTGKWVQVGRENTTFFQVADITGDTIECRWHVVEDGAEHLYWSGSFTAPENGAEPYSWVSQNNLERAKTSNWALRDETKTFTYEDGNLTYIVSMGNMRMTVSLEKI